MKTPPKSCPSYSIVESWFYQSKKGTISTSPFLLCDFLLCKVLAKWRRTFTLGEEDGI